MPIKIMSKTVNIKKKHKMYPLFVGTSMFMLFVSAICLYIAAYSGVMKGIEQLSYMIISAIGILFFLMCTMYLFFNLISPAIGVSVSAAGIRDYTTAGKGAGFIPKESILSLKLFGKDNKEFLGITVLPDYVDGLGLNKAAKREIQNNIESGTPAVIIRQTDVNVPLYKLMKLMVNKFERNAPAGSVKACTAAVEVKPDNTETISVLQSLNELVLSADKIEAFSNEGNNEIIALDFEDEVAPAPVINNTTTETELTLITVDEAPARPKTVDEMLMALSKDKKFNFSPITIDDNDEKND